MTPVFQTKFGVQRWPFEPGDCLSACVASILEVPVQEVPGFVDLRDDRDGLWQDRLDAWLWPMGLVSASAPPGAPPPGFSVAHGLSVKGNEHAVVAEDGCVVHDPHPSRTGLARVDGYLFFVGAGEADRLESFREHAEHVLRDVAAFRATLGPRDLMLVQIGLHASHMEEAIVAGDELRAEAHLRALVGLVGRIG